LSITYRLDSRERLILQDQALPAICQFLSNRLLDSPIEAVACVTLQFAFTQQCVEAVVQGIYRLVAWKQLFKAYTGFSSLSIAAVREQQGSLIVTMLIMLLHILYQ
jgi:hypothetical protein